MTEDKTVSVMAEGPKSTSLLTVLAGVSVLIIVALAAYLGLQKSTLMQEQDRLKVEVSTLNDEIAQLENQEIEAAQLAQEWLQVLEGEEIRWSLVLSQVQSLIPFDVANNENKVEFLSYSGSEGGRISMNAQTRPVSREPFDDVAELIEVFNDSSFFFDAYVPSITRAETDEGMKLASFVFNAVYEDKGFEDIKVEADEAAETIETAETVEADEMTETTETVEVDETTETSETTEASSVSAPISIEDSKIPR